MPVARAFTGAANVPVVATGGGGAATDGGATEAGDGDGDGDDKTYCFCDGVSFGEMIACDDTSCEREWVSAILLVCPQPLIDRPFAVPSRLHWFGSASRRPLVL